MKVLIIGAGIAGPATAIALAKAGIDSELFEARPARSADGEGAFLTITANGQDALTAIDAAEQVHELSFPNQRLRLFDSTGAKVADAVLGGERAPSRTISRADLSRALRGIAVSRSIPTLYGKRLVTAETATYGGVTAIFDDGTSASGDLLVGADGIHSPVRSLIDPASPSPRYVGLVVVSGYAPGQPEAVDSDGYSMYYGRQAFFGCTQGPDDRTWWFARIPTDEETADHLAVDPSTETIAHFFDVDDTPAAELIRASGPSITVAPARDIAHLPTWSANNMIVIGDAAHPLSPKATQGASLSIEDAAILARCLRDIDPIPAALHAFEQLRRERVEQIVRFGASAENPASSTLGSGRNSRPSPVLDHHIEWDRQLKTAL